MCCTHKPVKSIVVFFKVFYRYPLCSFGERATEPLMDTYWYMYRPLGLQGIKHLILCKAYDKELSDRYSCGVEQRQKKYN